MSRIGKQPVQLPEGATVDIKDKTVVVKGPKGELSMNVHPRASVSKETLEQGDALVVKVKNEKEDTAIWGTMRSVLENLVEGVTKGFSKSLELNGVGFRMNLQGSKLVMNLGFSHDVEYEVPNGIEAEVDGSKLTISGIDKQLVGQTAAEIRSLKKPEPYKGKGFKYTDEVIRRKVGKAAKTE